MKNKMKNKLMRKLLLLVTILAASMVCFESCSSCHHKKTMSMIPDDAAMVIVINMDEIWDKGDFKHIDQLGFVQSLRKELKNENPDAAKIVNDLLEDPKSCGLNLKGDIVFFISSNNTAFGCQVRSSSKFKKFLENLDKNTDIGFDISKENDYNLAFSKDANLAFCWDGSNAYGFPSPSEKKAVKQADNLMSIKKDNSMAKNEHFKEFMKNAGDIGVFMNFENLMHITRRDLEEVKDQIKPLKEASCYLSLNFEEGDIKVQCKVLGLEEGKYGLLNDNFNAKLTNYLPEQAFAAGALAVNISTILKNNKAPELDDEIVYGGYSTREVLKSFKGSIAASISSISFDYYGNPIPMFTIVADVSNKDVISQTLIDLSSNNRIKYDGNNYYINMDGNNVVIKLEDNILMASNDPSAIDALSNGGNSKGIKKIASEAKNGNYVYLDLDIDDYPSSLKNMIDRNLVKIISGLFEKAELKFPEPYTMEFTISLQNKSENSLKHILKHIDDNLGDLR